LYSLWKKHYGLAGDPLILVAQAPSMVMNPTSEQSRIDRAIATDPADAQAEYFAQFRSDVCVFIDREVVLENVMPGVREIPPARGISYTAFADPSGGSADSYALAIGHARGDIIVIDCVREIPAPFSPQVATAELAVLLKTYSVTRVVGDHFAGEWPAEDFAKHGIQYELSPAPKSTLYLSALPMLNSGRLEMPDNPRLIGQICNLERRTGRGGKDRIDHPPGMHDDCANYVLGLATIVVGSAGCTLQQLKAINDEGPSASKAAADAAARERAKRLHPGMSEADYRRISEPAPTFGPLAPGAVDLGWGGYRAPTLQERVAAERRERERVQAEFAKYVQGGGKL
jgi:hypothetical protein